MQPTTQSTIVIENWVSPLSALTPSLIVHNLELQGIQLPQSLTIEIDRGHYDCTDTNYAVITVRTDGPILFMNFSVQPQSFHCSFFSQKAVQGMDPAILQQHWLGNCYLHVGYMNAPMCSFRHESGYAKTWKKMAPPPSTVKAHHLREPAPAPFPEEADDDDAMSIDPVPVCPSPQRCNNNNDKNNNKNNNASKTKSKDNIRIIQLQKKNLLLRTELDMLKSEFRDLKAEVVAMKEALGTVREDQVGLAQRHKDQEAATRRANQCMQDWANKQIVERVWILEMQQQKEQQQQQQPCKYKSLRKKMNRLSERVVQLENVKNHNNHNNYNEHSFCNKCNNDDCMTNPFDFREIYDHYDQPDDYSFHHDDAIHEANNDTMNEDDDSCPALELIANYYAEEPDMPATATTTTATTATTTTATTTTATTTTATTTTAATTTNEPKKEDSDFDDDDFFEIEVEVIYEDGPK